MLRTARFSLVLVVLLTLQTTWMADLRPFGVVPDLLLLLTIGGAMAAGPVRGATIGFVAGLALDFVVVTPFGLMALAYLAVGYAVGLVHDSVVRSAPWIPVAVAMVASVLGIGFYVILGQLVGQHFRIPQLPVLMAVSATLNGVLIFPTLMVTRWIENAEPDRMMATYR